MTVSENVPARRPLRLWPGVVAVALQWAAFLPPLFIREAGAIGVLGGAAGGLLVLVWWLFFSRAPWVERIGAVLLAAASVALAYFVVHPSIANGLMGRMLPVFSIPLFCLALVVSVAATRGLSTGRRRAIMAVAIPLAVALMTVVRTGGVTGDANSDLHWRWTTTPEERLLAQPADDPLPPPAAPPSAAPAAEPPVTARPTPAPETAPGAGAKTADAARPAAAKAAEPAAPSPVASAVTKTHADWPGFRGPRRDGVVRGARLETDWSRAAPVELWRRPVGPGWSSFAVHGAVFYTQEQRGEDEIVSAYDLATGKPVWRHRDAARFWESNAGAGPRGTPAYSNGRVYTHGATGIVNALDARTGAVVWSRNASADTGSKIPGWGYASSPLVQDDAVIVASSGRLVAYDAATGTPRWTRQTQGGGYSSPQLMTIGGVAQIVLMSGGGATGVAPADGSVLWEHKWEDAVSIVQPALLADGDVLIVAGDAMGGLGIRRIAVSRGPGGWTVEERWTSRGLKPYFNDFVVHKGYAFGFDGRILSCIDVKDGNRLWKGGRYGNGQLVLLPDQDLLLVLSEEGELALVKATADQFTEVAKFKAVEGKTWNHPVLAGDVLLVRNGEEMAGFRVTLAER